MITAPPQSVDVIRRRHNRVPWKGAISTVVVVAAGSSLALWALPPVGTPDNIVRSYVEAEFAQDWETTWGLMCEMARYDSGDYNSYVNSRTRSADADRVDVDVSIGPYYGLGGSPTSATIAVAVAATPVDERRDTRTYVGDMLLKIQNGELRVCSSNLQQR
jgi:hypothetical protein